MGVRHRFVGFEVSRVIRPPFFVSCDRTGNVTGVLCGFLAMALKSVPTRCTSLSPGAYIVPLVSEHLTGSWKNNFLASLGCLNKVL